MFSSPEASPLRHQLSPIFCLFPRTLTTVGRLSLHPPAHTFLPPCPSLFLSPSFPPSLHPSYLLSFGAKSKLTSSLQKSVPTLWASPYVFLFPSCFCVLLVVAIVEAGARNRSWGGRAGGRPAGCVGGAGSHGPVCPLLTSSPRPPPRAGLLQTGIRCSLESPGSFLSRIS